MKNPSSIAASLAFAAGSLGGLAESAWAGDNPITYRTLALTGTQAPGYPPGVVFSGFESYFANAPEGDDDRVAFFALVSGSGIGTGESAIWVDEGAGARLIARPGQTAPGTGGAVFTGFPEPFIGVPPTLVPGARIVFAGSLAGEGVTTTNDSGLWVDAGGGISLLLREGTQAPALPAGVVFNQAFLPAMDEAGHAAFAATLRGAGVHANNDQVFYSGASGSLAVVAREGDLAPGTPAGVVFGPGDIGAAYQFTDARFNDSLQLVFNATLSGPGVDAFSDEGIFTNRTGTLTKLLREGDPAPGAGGGVTFGGDSVSLFVHSMSFNNLGQVAFNIRLGGSAPTTEAMYSDHRGSLEPVVMTGDPAPGTGGATFGILSTPILSDAGRIAFRATAGASGQWPPLGVWWDQTGPITALLLPGDTLASDDGGPAAGRTVLGVNFIRGFTTDGRIALSAGLDHPQIGSQDALLAGNGDSLRVIVATGEPFDVAGDRSDLRTITGINLGLQPMGRSEEAAHIAFRLTFSDGSSGIFSASISDPACPADFDGADGVGVPDIFAFLAAWFAGEPAADFDGADGVGVPDIFAFLAAWFSGCP